MVIDDPTTLGNAVKDAELRNLSNLRRGFLVRQNWAKNPPEPQIPKGRRTNRSLGSLKAACLSTHNVQ